MGVSSAGSDPWSSTAVDCQMYAVAAGTKRRPHRGFTGILSRGPVRSPEVRCGTHMKICLLRRRLTVDLRTTRQPNVDVKGQTEICRGQDPAVPTCIAGARIRSKNRRRQAASEGGPGSDGGRRWGRWWRRQWGAKRSVRSRLVSWSVPARRASRRRRRRLEQGGGTDPAVCRMYIQVFEKSGSWALTQ